MNPYEDLHLREPSGASPFVAINMVTTIDGKILSGGRDEGVMDLGSPVDHQAMRNIEAACDAVMIGAGTLRATKGLWYDARLTRIVVSPSGNLPYQSRFFTDAPEKAWVLTSEVGESAVPSNVQRIATKEPIEWPGVLERLGNELGVRRLLVEGGSELNASLLAQDVVDELFWTVAPKVRLGRNIPTYADGEPFPRHGLLKFSLVSNLVIDDEVFLRYRRSR
ncbi:MAG: dihydrofolate reductase family protein [Armatimonadetes bacterium]|nr:dihydrofolate reductase family protein [Armatimonadota bacterium]